jgi:hypothetical protein
LRGEEKNPVVFEKVYSASRLGDFSPACVDIDREQGREGEGREGEGGAKKTSLWSRKSQRETAR